MIVGNLTIERLNHSAFMINSKRLIYIDPFKIDMIKEADIILISHEHFDHCSIEDLKKIVTPNTRIVMPPDCQSKIASGKIKPKETLLVKPGVKLEIDGIHITAVPAYNTNKNFHPKENDWVGYLIESDGIRIYHSGDTDVIPEMKNLGKIDVACLPVSGTYVMTAKEAVQAAEIINPKVVIPMHYGAVVGSVADAHQFKSLWKGRTEILGPEGNPPNPINP